jgi:hypothetical protein
MGTAYHVSRTICLDRENVCALCPHVREPRCGHGSFARTHVRWHRPNAPSKPILRIHNVSLHSHAAGLPIAGNARAARSWPGNASAWRGGVVAISESACTWQQGHAAAGSGLTVCACLPVALLCSHLATCFSSEHGVSNRTLSMLPA